MKKFHLALGVKNIQESIEDYTKRLAADPIIVIPNEYALFRTESLNISIRKSATVGLRHLGWEDEKANTFTEDKDCNDITWERFNQSDQIKEIQDTWPGIITH